LSKRIYVGNLPFTSNEEDVRALFASYGEVVSVTLPNDRETGRPRGFGFVEMDNDAADQAIRSLDGKEFGGRSLRVNEARESERGGGGGPRRDDRRGGFGGGGGGRRF
jgi:RNA recognition motif-containing protein